MDEQQFDYLNGIYTQQPYLFNTRQADELAQTALTLNRRFERNPEHGEFSIANTLKQLGSGFVQGFTTLNVGDDPKNSIEAIARSVGSLLGFVGYIPGPGLGSKLAVTAVGSALKLDRIFTGGANALTRLPVRSIPMLVAERVVSSVERAGPLAHAMKFLSPKVQDIAREGMRLGVASATSSWQYGVDEMAKGFLRGAYEGAGFRALSNLVRTGDATSDTILRAASSAMYSGLPATLADEPLEFQVYQYLLGGYFGMRDVPWRQMEAARFMGERLREIDGPNAEAKRHFARMTPTELRGFGDLPGEVRDELIQHQLSSWGRALTVVDRIKGASTVGEGAAIAAEAYRKMEGLIPREVFGKLYETMWDSVRKTRVSNPEELAVKTGKELMTDLDRLLVEVDKKARPVAESEWNLRAVEDKEIPTYIATPMRRLGELSKVEGFLQAASERVVRTLKENSVDSPELHERIRQEIAEVDPDVTKQKDFDQTVRQVVRSYGGRAKRQVVHDEDNGFLLISDENPRSSSGKLLNTRVHSSHLDSTLERVGSTPLYLKNLVQQGAWAKEDVPIYEAGLTLPQFLSLRTKGAMHGFRPYGSVKDKGEIILSDGFLWETTPNRQGVVPTGADAPLTIDTVGSYLTQRMASLDAVAREVGMDQLPSAVYAERKAAFLEQLGSEKGVTLGPYSGSEYFDASYVHDMMVNELLNSTKDGKVVTLETQLRNKGRFVDTPSGKNIRLQLVSDENPTSSPEWYRDIKVGEADERTLADAGGIPYIILRRNRRSVSDPSTVEGGEYPRVKSLKKGVVVDEPAAEHMDSHVVMRRDIRERAKAEQGLDLDAGSSKMAVVYADETDANGNPLGMALIKTNPQDATETMDRLMHQLGVGMVVFEDAVKQTGLRNVYEYRITKDGQIEFYEALPEGQKHKGRPKKAVPEIYKVPFDGLRWNAGASEHASQGSTPVNAVLQMHTMIDDPTAWRAALESWFDPTQDGNPEIVSKYRAGQLSRFSLDNMGMQDVLDEILPEQGIAKGSDLFDRIWRDVLKDDGNLYDAEADFDDTIRAREAPSGAARRMFEVAMRSGKLTPAIVYDNAAMQEYAMGVLTNYVIRRMQRPRMTESGTATMYGWDGTHQLEIMRYAESLGENTLPTDVRVSLAKGVIPKGWFMAAEGMRDLPMKDENGKRTTLGEMWERYQSSEDISAPKRAVMENLMTLALVRVPADSPAAVRISRFAGFVKGMKGAGVYQHPDDMRNENGADVDGDKVFIFQDLDRKGTGDGPLRRYFESRRDMWYKDGGYIDGEVDYGDEILRPQKASEKHFAAMFDPMIAWETGRSAYNGNRLIGTPALSVRRTIAMLYDTGGKRIDASARLQNMEGVLPQSLMRHISFTGDDDLRPAFSVSARVELADNANDLVRAARALIYRAAASAKAPIAFETHEDASRWLASKIVRSMDKPTIEVLAPILTQDQDGLYAVGQEYVSPKEAREIFERIVREPNATNKAKAKAMLKALKSLPDMEAWRPTLDELGPVSRMARADAKRGADGRVLPLGERIERIRNSLGGLDVGGTWYQIMQRIGGLKVSRLGMPDDKPNRIYRDQAVRMDPIRVAPYHSVEAIRRTWTLMEEMFGVSPDATPEAVREAEINKRLVGMQVAFSTKNTSYDALWKVQNDMTDVISALTLRTTGRRILDELGEEAGMKRVRELQRAVHNPSSSGTGKGFRQRLHRAMRLKSELESGMREEVAETVDDVYRDMSAYAETLTPKPNERAYFEMLVISSSQPNQYPLKTLIGKGGIVPKRFASQVDDPSTPLGAHYANMVEVLLDDTVFDKKGELSSYERKRRSLWYKYADEVGLPVRWETMSEADKRTHIRDSLFKKTIESAKAEYERSHASRPMMAWDGISPQTWRNWFDAQRSLNDYQQARVGKGIETQDTLPKTEEAERLPAREAIDQMEKTLNLLIGEGRDDLLKQAREGGFLDPSTDRGRENARYVDELVDLFVTYPQAAQYFPEILPASRSPLDDRQTSVLASTRSDIAQFVDAVSKHRRGNFIRSLFGGGADGRELPKWAYWFFPDTVGRWLLPHDFHISDQVLRQVLTPDGIMDMPVRGVFSTIDKMQNTFSIAHDEVASHDTRLTEEWSSALGWLMTDQTRQDARDMYMTAIAIRQLRHSIGKNGKPDPSSEYYKRWKQLEPVYERLKDKRFSLLLPRIMEDGRVLRKNERIELENEARSVTGADLMGNPVSGGGYINDVVTDWTTRIYNKWIVNEEAEQKHLVRYAKSGEIDYEATMRGIVNHMQRHKSMPIIGLNGLYRLAHEQELRGNIIVDVEHITPTGEKSVESGTLTDLLAEGRITEKEFNAELRRLRIELPFEYLSHEYEDRDIRVMGGTITVPKRANKTTPRMIGKVPFDVYYPQNGHDRHVAAAFIKEQLEKAVANGESPSRIKEMEIEFQRHYAMGLFPDDMMTDPLRTMAFRGPRTFVEAKAEHESPDRYLLPRPAFTRTRREQPLPGWDPTERAMGRYNRSVIKGYYDTVATLVAQHDMKRFQAISADSLGPHAKDWIEWQKVYLQTFLGHNTMYPDSMLGPQAKITNTPAYFFSDRAMWDRYKKFARLIGGKKWEEIKDADLDSPQAQRFATQLRRFSQMEGKYQMMTLLANTRALANNIFGGNMMTMVSTGFRPFLRTFSAKARAEIRYDWKDWSKYADWAMEKGAIENWIISEANLSGSFNSENAKRFLQDSLALFRKKPAATDSEIQKLARKHGLTEDFVNTSAWFMRVSERSLRLRSFLAHYMKWREVLMLDGKTAEVDDPWLIEQALKGVKGTQFLYHSTSRPLWAASSVGKMFSRFQLWSWNSVRFRRDVYKAARDAGYQPGTESFERFRRTMQADLFMFGLASALPMTMFESTLPAPASYVRELSQFFFGDNEEERENAFFGILPYPLNAAGIILPPSARVFTVLGALMGGDVDRFLDYHIFTLAPFGLMARNVMKTAENPTFVVEAMTGIPLHRAARLVKETRETNNEAFIAPSMLRDAA